MPRRLDIPIHSCSAENVNDAGTKYLIQANNGLLYCVFIHTDLDVYFRFSSNGGLTWGNPVAIFVGSATHLSVWYDRWSGLTSDLIHVAYTESVTDDTLYRTINTASSDALSTQTVIFAGSTTATGGHLSITRARGGNVYCKTVIDAGAEGGFYRLLNANVPAGAWDAARTVDEAIATTDQMILVPGFAADNQDIMAIFWDASADEISRKIYDDSANTWSETSISTGMVDQVATTNFPHFAAAVDLANSQIILIAWNGVDLLNADLRCWTITEGAITAKTDVVLNSADDQGLAALALDTVTGNWWAFYCGKSDGSETYSTSIQVYCKVSTDSGATWGPEIQVTEIIRSRRGLWTIPRFSGMTMPPVSWLRNVTVLQQEISAELLYPSLTHQHAG